MIAQLNKAYLLFKKVISIIYNKSYKELLLNAITVDGERNSLKKLFSEARRVLKKLFWYYKMVKEVIVGKVVYEVIW